MPAKDPNSKPDSSKKAPPQQKQIGRDPLDKVYWSRALLAALGGLTSGVTFGLIPQPMGGILVGLTFYFASVLVARYLVGELVAGERQLYTQGIGTYLLMWFSVFVLYTTLVLWHPS